MYSVLDNLVMIIDQLKAEIEYSKSIENARMTAFNEAIDLLKEIVDLAYDIHTRDPINIKEKWGAMGNAAERLLIDKIEALKGE